MSLVCLFVRSSACLFRRIFTSGQKSDVTMFVCLFNLLLWAIVLYSYFLCPTNNSWRKHYDSSRPSVRPSVSPSVVRPLTPISRDATSPYWVEGFQRNLSQTFIMWVGIAEKDFKIGGQRSRSWPDHLTYNRGCIHFDGVASKLTCVWWNRLSSRLTIRCSAPVGRR